TGVLNRATASLADSRGPAAGCPPAPGAALVLAGRAEGLHRRPTAPGHGPGRSRPGPAPGPPTPPRQEAGLPPGPAPAGRPAGRERAARTDADEAITLLAQVGKTSAFEELHTLAERYLATDPAKALRFAEEAIVRARTLDQPRRTWSLAEAANLILRLQREAA